MRRQPFRQPSNAGLHYCAEGISTRDFEPGDFLLTHGDAWTSKMIRLGQRLRIHGEDRKYTHWNHAALIASAQGDIIEALGAGVVKRHMDVYEPREYVVVNTDSTPQDRDQVVEFARWSLSQPYGYLTIVAIAYSLLTGGKFTFSYEGQQICSGLVARSQERTQAIFNRPPSHVMPADLAKYYAVDLPVMLDKSNQPEGGAT